MLPKKFRLPVENFDKIYHKGEKARGNYGMLISVSNDIDNPRIGFVVSKKIGNAVLRHRMTRILRVSFIEIINEMNLSTLQKDFQYIAFKYCDKKNLLKKEMENQFRKMLDD
jgi:ribonuclease P protein component